MNFTWVNRKQDQAASKSIKNYRYILATWIVTLDYSVVFEGRDLREASVFGHQTQKIWQTFLGSRNLRNDCPTFLGQESHSTPLCPACPQLGPAVTQWLFCHVWSKLKVEALLWRKIRVLPGAGMSLYKEKLFFLIKHFKCHILQVSEALENHLSIYLQYI